jgi:hypothetical protein
VDPTAEAKREIFRAADDAQRISDKQLRFLPDYAAQINEAATSPPIANAIYGRSLTHGGNGRPVPGADPSPRIYGASLSRIVSKRVINRLISAESSASMTDRVFGLRKRFW